MKNKLLNNINRSFYSKKLYLLFLLIVSVSFFSIKFGDNVFAQQSCSANMLCTFFTGGGSTPCTPYQVPEGGTATLPTNCGYNTGLVPPITGGTCTYTPPGQYVCGYSDPPTNTIPIMCNYSPITSTGGCSGSCGASDYSGEISPSVTYSAACGEIQAVESACNTAWVPAVIAPTTGVCANAPEYYCGQTFHDPCENSPSYATQCTNTGTSTEPTAGTTGGTPSSGYINGSHTTKTCVSVPPTIQIRQGCAYETQPYQAMNAGGSPIPEGSSCKNQIGDQIHTMNLGIFGNGNPIATTSGPLVPPVSIANYSTLNSSPSTLSFGIEYTAPHGVKDLQYFISVYHDDNGSMNKWTLIKDYAGKTPGTTTGGNKVIDSSFTPANGLVYQDLGAYDAGTGVYNMLSTQTINALMTQYQGMHVAFVWGIKGEDVCGYQDGYNYKNDYLQYYGKCQDGVPAVQINPNKSIRSTDAYQDLDSTIDPTFQVMIFDRAPEGVILYTTSRDNTTAGQGIDESAQYDNVSGNAVFNYFNQVYNKGYLTAANYDTNHVVLPLKESSGNLPNGQVNYSNTVGTDGNIATPTQTDAAVTGYGPSSKYPNVGNPVDYVLYYRAYDGIGSLTNLTLNYQYSNDLGQTANVVNAIHSTVDFKCNGGLCNPAVIDPLGKDVHGNGQDIAIDPAHSKATVITYDKVAAGDLANDVVSIKLNKLEYELLSSTNGDLTNPDGFSNYNDQSNAFGDGNYQMLLGAIDNLYPNISDIQYQPYNYNTKVTYGSVVKVNGQNYDYVNTNISQTPPGIGASGSHYQLANWYVAVNTPRGFASPIVVDAKHLTMDWCGFTDKSNLNCDNVSQPAVSLPNDAMAFQFVEKEWNARNDAATSWASYEPNNLVEVYYSANNTKPKSGHPYDLCETSLSKWANDTAGDNPSNGGADFDQSYTPFVTECSAITSTNSNGYVLSSSNMSTANGTNTILDQNLGTADPNGPLSSKREYVYRLIMADALGNFATPNSMNGVPVSSKAKGSSGGVDIGAPWSQVIDGSVYVENFVNMNVQNVPSKYSYLPTNTGNSLVRNGTCAIAEKNGGGPNNFGLTNTGGNSTCNDIGDNPGSTLNFETGSKVDQSIINSQYTFAQFFAECKKNGECQNAGVPSSWVDGNNMLIGGTGGTCITTDSAGDKIRDLSSACIKTNGWLYTPNDLYVGFDPTTANKCVPGSSPCVPDVNRPEDPLTGTFYKGQAIILVGGNLYVQPDLIYNDYVADGYIFIVQKNIRILSTKPITPTALNPVHYDYVDGYFYAATSTTGNGGSLTVDRQRCYENATGLTINGCKNYN